MRNPYKISYWTLYFGYDGIRSKSGLVSCRAIDTFGAVFVLCATSAIAGDSASYDPFLVNDANFIIFSSIFDQNFDL